MNTLSEQILFVCRGLTVAYFLCQRKTMWQLFRELFKGSFKCNGSEMFCMVIANNEIMWLKTT